MRQRDSASKSNYFWTWNRKGIKDDAMHCVLCILNICPIATITIYSVESESLNIFYSKLITFEGQPLLSVVQL